MGRSGAFSRVCARVFSAHFFSASDGWRFSNIPAIGLSATCGFFSMRSPVLYLDDREAEAVGARSMLVRETTGRFGFIVLVHSVVLSEAKGLCSLPRASTFIDPSRKKRAQDDTIIGLRRL